MRESVGIAHSLRRGIAAADDGDRGRREALYVAARVENRRRIVDLQQRGRVRWIAECEELIAFALDPVERRLEEAPVRSRGNQAGYATVAGALRDGMWRRRQYALGCSECGEELALRAGGDPRKQRQPQPGNDVAARRGDVQGNSCRDRDFRSTSWQGAALTPRKRKGGR